MSSAVSSTTNNVPSTPILVTTPSTESTPKASSTPSQSSSSSNDFNNIKRDDSCEDQRHLNKQNSASKIYTRVSWRSQHTLYIIKNLISLLFLHSQKKMFTFLRVTAIKINSSREVMQWKSRHRHRAPPIPIRHATWNHIRRQHRPSSHNRQRQQQQQTSTSRQRRHHSTWQRHRHLFCRSPSSRAAQAKASSTLIFPSLRRQRRKSAGTRHRRPAPTRARRHEVTIANRCRPTRRRTTTQFVRIPTNLMETMTAAAAKYLIKKQDLKFLTHRLTITIITIIAMLRSSKELWWMRRTTTRRVSTARTIKIVSRPRGHRARVQQTVMRRRTIRITTAARNRRARAAPTWRWRASRR